MHSTDIIFLHQPDFIFKGFFKQIISTEKKLFFKKIRAIFCKALDKKKKNPSLKIKFFFFFKKKYNKKNLKIN